MYSRWFKGTFAHLPGILCDNFNDLNGDQFFLTHCHADHMEGLDKLFDKLNSSNSVRINHRIYCSAITKAFLIQKFKLVDKRQRFVSVLAPNEPQTIDVFDQRRSIMYKLRVTPIPANHCPGSVMFLFESLKEDGTLHKRILYTGDFRYEDTCLSTLTALHDSRGQALKLDEMYLDTTFCSKNYETFPSRTESLQATWNIVTGWIKKNGTNRRNQKAKKHVVLFSLPAQYGCEAILRDIYERSGSRLKIHVSQKKFEDYLCSEDLGGCTESDPARAEWIHACSWTESAEQNPKPDIIRSIPCQDGLFEVCRIRPCALFFTQDRLPKTPDEPPIKCEGGTNYRVCYSCHSSLTELQEFVKYFQPKKVIPCDRPRHMKYEEVCQLLNSVLDSPPPTSSDVRGQSSFVEFSPMSIAATSSDDENETNKHSAFSHNRKRKILPHGESNFLDNKRQLTELVSMESFDDDDEASQMAKCKRLVFQRSRQDKGANSMPSESMVKKKNGDKSSRRASLPHNLKIPLITITAPSPSPDINDPDYPEFFQDKPYLESKNGFVMSTSIESGAGDDLKMLTDGPSSASGSLESSKEIVSSGFTTSTPSCQQLHQNDDVFLPLRSKSFTSTISLSDTEDYDMLQSTPDFEEILASAQTDREIMNCIKFKEQENKI